MMITESKYNDSIEIYAYGTSKDQVSKKDKMRLNEIKCRNIIKWYKNN